MRLVRTAILAATASAALAGAAFAAHDDAKVMLIALPDGSVQQVRYQGDVAPQIVLVRAPAPVSLFDAAFGPDSPFAEMDRISAMMEARSQAMMRQAAAMQVQAAQAPAGNGIVMTNAQGEPVGTMHYSFTSSTTSADGCTQTVSYSSDGAATADQPRVIRTSTGSCGASPAAPAGKAVSPVTPTGTAPAAKPAPKITPVSLPAELKAFTPSRT
jgi:hypothetical protein